MDVDEEEQGAEGDEDNEEDAEMEVDDEGNPITPKKKTKKTKAKRRKSELDMTAMTTEQAALTALESNQILLLRLRKKYYVEALNFIRQLDGAMEMLGQLLGSTNKAEVLEVMDFFRVALEYKLEGAEVCFLCSFFYANETMTHAIYTAWDQENAPPDLVKRQQLYIRRWKRTQGCSIATIRMLQEFVL